MIALPVTAITGAVTAVATMSVSGSEGLTSSMGAADAVVEAWGMVDPDVHIGPDGS